MIEVSVLHADDMTRLKTLKQKSGDQFSFYAGKLVLCKQIISSWVSYGYKYNSKFHFFFVKYFDVQISKVFQNNKKTGLARYQNLILWALEASSNIEPLQVTCHIR